MAAVRSLLASKGCLRNGYGCVTTCLVKRVPVINKFLAARIPSALNCIYRSCLGGEELALKLPMQCLKSIRSINLKIGTEYKLE